MDFNSGSQDSNRGANSTNPSTVPSWAGGLGIGIRSAAAAQQPANATASSPFGNLMPFGLGGLNATQPGTSAGLFNHFTEPQGLGGQLLPGLATGLAGTALATASGLPMFAGVMAGAAAALSNEHKPPTLDDYRGQGDKDIQAKILANRTSRTALDKQRQANDPAAGDAETHLNGDRTALLADLKERSGVYDASIQALSAQLPEKLPKNLTPEQQRLVAERTQLETEKGKFSDQQTSLQRWQDRNDINRINAQLDDPKLDPKERTRLLAEKKTLATGLLSTTKSYQQFDDRWGDTVYGKDKSYTTMTEAGCGPTALAMMMDFRDQEDPEGQHSRGVQDPYTPRKMADYATRHGRVKGSGTDGATMMGDLAASFPGFAGNTLNNRANATKSLRDGIPVAFLGHNITGAGADGDDVTPYKGHYMLLNGVSDDGNTFNVHDGGRNNARNIHSITGRQLDGHTTNYWNVSHKP